MPILRFAGSSNRQQLLLVDIDHAHAGPRDMEQQGAAAALLQKAALRLGARCGCLSICMHGNKRQQSTKPR
jgi:hypothetical protein